MAAVWIYHNSSSEQPSFLPESTSGFGQDDRRLPEQLTYHRPFSHILARCLTFGVNS